MTRKREHVTHFIELWVILLTFLISLVWWTQVTHAQPTFDPLELLLSTKMTYATVNGYTATLIKDENGAGKSETIFLKFQKPFRVYMKWIKDPHRGREVLYVEGQNDDKVIAKPDGLVGKLIRVVKLDPADTRKSSKRTIKEVGIGNMLDRILEHTLFAQANGDLQLYYRGLKEVNGRRVHEIERVLPEKKYYLAHRLVVYVDEQLNLPVEVYCYDWKNQLAEHYAYRDLNTNAPLGDLDFKTSNKHYGFRYL